MVDSCAICINSTNAGAWVVALLLLVARPITWTITVDDTLCSAKRRFSNVPRQAGATVSISVTSHSANGVRSTRRRLTWISSNWFWESFNWIAADEWISLMVFWACTNGGMIPNFADGIGGTWVFLTGWFTSLILTSLVQRTFRIGNAFGSAIGR